VAIAVALANKPILLLADEPTGEVDSATAQTILETFRRLNETLDLTTIIVTHEPHIVGQVDRVVAIRDGKTSTETIRQVSQLEQAMVGERLPDEAAEEVTYHEYVVLDSAGRLQVPREYLEQFDIGDRATLEMSDEGLIRPVAGRQEAATSLLPGFAEEEPPVAPRRRGLRGLWARLRKR
jgi:putative ABC transport system ATP-binding protein